MQDAAPLDAEDADRPTWPIDRIGLVVGPLSMALWIWLGPRGGLTEPAHRLAGVWILTIVWWLTEPIPIAATGLLAVAMAVFVGAVPEASAEQAAKVALTPFADGSVYFLLGGMFLARAMSRHGLDRRIALSILCTRWAGRSPSTVLLAVGLSVAVVSMWISNTAATAMVFPVAMGMIEVLAAGQGEAGRKFPRSPYASALLLMTAYASSVGGISTPIGTATNVVAMGFFKRPEYFGQPVDFARWSAVGLPASALLFVGLFLWLRLRAPAGELNLPALRDYLQNERRSLGPWKIGEVNTLIVFLTVVFLWVAPSPLALFGSPEAASWYRRHFPEEIVALLAPVLLFLLPVDWKNREFSLSPSDFRKLDWATMLLFGAGLSLGNLMFQTGLADWIGHWAFETLGTRDVWAVTMLAAGGGIVLSEFTSNAATATTLIPVVHALCKEAGVDAVAPLMAVAFSASFGSALPVSTPPNAIVYGSGLIPVRRMIAAGTVFDVVCFVAVVAVLRLAVGSGWTPVG